MMRRKKTLICLLFWVALCGVPQISCAQLLQRKQQDSLLKKLPFLKQDSTAVKTYDKLADLYVISNLYVQNDSNCKAALLYAGKALTLAQKIKWLNGIGLSYCITASAYVSMSVNDEAIKYAKMAYNLSPKPSYKSWIYAYSYPIYYNIALSYFLYPSKTNYPEALKIGQDALKLYADLPDNIRLSYFELLIAQIYLKMHDNKDQVIYEMKSVARVRKKNTTIEDIYILQEVAELRRNRNDLAGSLEALEWAKSIINKNTSTVIAIKLYSVSAAIYETLGENMLALKAESGALKIIDNNVNSLDIGYSYFKINSALTIGRLYRIMGDYDKAIAFLRMMLADKRMNEPYYKRDIRDEMAESYFMEGNFEQAWENLKPGIIWQDSSYRAEHKDLAKINQPLLLAKLYRDAPDSIVLKTGIKLANRYLEAEKIFKGDHEIIGISSNQAIQYEVYNDLYKTYEKAGESNKAYEAYKKYVTIRDSVTSLNNANAVIRKDMQISYTHREDSIHLKQVELNTQLQLSNKEKEVQQAKLLQTHATLQAEQSRRMANEQKLKATQKEEALANSTVDLQKTEISAKRAQTYYLMGGIGAMIGLSFFIAQNYRNQKRSNQLLTSANTQITAANLQISAEKQRSDDLLLNILPADVAEELKEKGSSDARLFDEVTVLFTDFVNFTTVSELLTPQELVNELNVCFKAFDGIMTTHQIEKIKTVGDAYLAVSGLPLANVSHAANLIRAAQEIQQFMLERKLEMGDKSFGIRIGIHSGSVVAGIVGVKKFAYDIWGDTVNTAARMEQNCEAGKINVSEKTYELVKDQFAFTYRGEIAAKNKGMMKMYFAENVPVFINTQQNK